MIDESFWEGRKVFITGHTGFKGSWLCLWLHILGAEVTGYALDPPTDPSLRRCPPYPPGRLGPPRSGDRCLPDRPGTGCPRTGQERMAPARDVARGDHARRGGGAALVAEHPVLDRQPRGGEPVRLGQCADAHHHHVGIDARAVAESQGLLILPEPVDTLLVPTDTT